MARIIDIEFNGKQYTVEYNRIALLMLAQNKVNEDETISSLVNLLHYGLYKHHKNDMPSDDELLDLLNSVDDLEGFMQVLGECVRETAQAIQDNSNQPKNAKWVAR